MKTYQKLLAISFLGLGVVTASCTDDDDAVTPLDAAAGSSGADGGAGSSGTGGGGSAGTATDAGPDVSAGGDGSATPDGGAADVGADAVEAGVDGPPALGMQIDRMGRPGVNTALTDPFGIAPGMSKDQVKDAYNAASDPATWSQFSTEIARNLAVLDALNSTSTTEGCGSQFAIGTATDGGTANRYSALAGVLADDRLYLNTKVGDAGTLSCTQYLAVEGNATTLVPNGDCGGRTPTYDVIDTTYSVLAAGTLTGVSDGVPTDGKTTSTFPFLAAPQ